MKSAVGKRFTISLCPSYIFAALSQPLLLRLLETKSFCSTARHVCVQRRTASGWSPPPPPAAAFLQSALYTCTYMYAWTVERCFPVGPSSRLSLEVDKRPVLLEWAKLHMFSKRAFLLLLHIRTSILVCVDLPTLRVQPVSGKSGCNCVQVNCTSKLYKQL